MRAGIGLGSNLEPRLLTLQQARRRLLALHADSSLVLCSKVYETAPVDCPPDSPHFLNAVLEISTRLDPTRLLEALQQIEVDLGRPPDHAHHAPRTIDLDLLYCGTMTLHAPGLTLPHPRIAERLFVLQPLADIRPDLTLPGSPATVRELLSRCDQREKPAVFCNSIY